MILFHILTIIFLVRGKKKGTIRGAVAFLILSAICDAALFVGLNNDPKQQGVVGVAIAFLVIDALLLIWMISVKGSLKKKEQIQQVKEEKTREEIQQSNRNDKILKYYDSCREHTLVPGVPGFEDGILLIAKNMSLADNRETALQLYDEGKKLFISRASGNLLNRVMQQRKKIEAENTENEELAKISGKEKYLLLAEALQEDLDELVKGTRQLQAFVDKGPGQVSYHEKSWGIAGGIASGIAGPAAGLIAASETIKENERRKADADATNRMLKESWQNIADNIGNHKREDNCIASIISKLVAGVEELLIDDADPEAKLALLKCDAKVSKIGEALENGGQTMTVNVSISPAKPLKVLNSDAFMDGALLIRCLKNGEQYGKGFIMPEGYVSTLPDRQVTSDATYSKEYIYDLSKSSLRGSHSIAMVAEAGKHFSPEDHYSFTFEPVTLWLTEKKIFKGRITYSDEIADTAFRFIQTSIEKRGGIKKAILAQYRKKHAVAGN